MPAPRRRQLPAPRRGQGQGQVGHPDLPLGRHVAQRHLGSRSPTSGHDYMGEFAKAIPTNVDGIQLGELFPELAKQADKFSLIRSMTHRNNGHETAAYLMQTGHTPGRAAGLPERRGRVRAVQEPGLQGADPALRRADPAAGAVLRRGFPGAASTSRLPRAATRTRQRFEVEGVVARGHHRRTQAGPARTARQAEHAGPRDGGQPAVGGRGGGQEAGLRSDPRPRQGGVRSLARRSPSCGTGMGATRSGRIAWQRGGWSKPASPMS